MLCVNGKWCDNFRYVRTSRSTMDRSRQKKYQTIVVVCGSIVMALPQGLIIFWGNLTVYVYSYYMSRGVLTLETPWVVSVFFMLRNLGLMLQGSIRNHIGHRSTAVLGILIANFGAFLSFFTVQISLNWLIVTIGAVFGFGSGIINGWVFQLVLDHADKNVALLTSLILASINAGGMVMNQMITFYINPTNWQTDLNMASGKYFTRKAVVDKVPSVFIALGLFILGTQILGFCLVESRRYISMCSEILNKEVHTVRANMQRSYRSVENSGSTTQLENRDSRNDSSMEVLNSCISSTLNERSSSTSEIEISEKEHTPKMILRSVLFYAMWMTFFFSELPFILLSNYYKLFGQLCIHDDNFLTVIGTTRAFCDMWGRILWGILMDKIGVKNTILIITTSMAITLTWYYFSLQVDKWVFFGMTVVLSNLCSAWFTSYISLTAALYGRKNISRNLGLLKSSSLVLNLLAPSFFDVMLTYGGWFYTFFSAGVMSFMASILIRIFLPNKV